MRDGLWVAQWTAWWTAAVLGTLHAASSAYWAFGGQFLLETVGQWAVDAAQQPTMASTIGLWGIAAVKLLAAWVPLSAELGRIPGRRWWRALAWIGGPALILYGGANAILGTAALAGWINADITDPTALAGHAYLWGPHFALWGIALTTALFLSRNRTTDTPH